MKFCDAKKANDGPGPWIATAFLQFQAYKIRSKIRLNPISILRIPKCRESDARLPFDYVLQSFVLNEATQVVSFQFF